MAANLFRKYDKMLENSGAVGAKSGSNQYVVTEKVHGANFCILATFADNEHINVSFAKRTAVIGSATDAEDFYNCRSCGLLTTLEPLAKAVLQRVSAENGSAPGASAISIYGELFGGKYEHPNVQTVPGLQPVQVGIWYAPNLHFMAFDVAVQREEQRFYLDFNVAQRLCTEAGLFFAAPLFIGTLAECVDFNNEFVTTIPARLGYPALQTSPDGLRNLAEGVVVRPRQEPQASMTSTKDSGRGIFKRKIEAFSEKRYQNDDWKRGKAGGCGRCPDVSALDHCRFELYANINDMRLAAVMSKIGRVDKRSKEHCRQLLEDFKQDVRDALEPGDLEQVDASVELQEELDQLSRNLITNQLCGAKRCGA